MPLKKLLTDLALKITPENKKAIEIIIKALGHPEYLLKDSTFTDTRINNKISDEKIAEILKKINTLLKNQFKTNISAYCSGEPHYECINSFWDNIDIIKQNEIKNSIQEKLLAIQKSDSELIEESKYSPEEDNSFESLDIEYSVCEKRLKLFTAELKDLIESYSEASGKQAFKLKVNTLKQTILLQKYKLLNKMAIPGDLLKYSVEDEMHLSIIKRHAADCASELYFIDKDEALKNFENLFVLLQENLKTVNDALLLWQASTTNYFTKITDITKHAESSMQEILDHRFDDCPEDFLENIKPLGLLPLPMTKDIDFQLGGKVFPEDYWMSQAYTIVPSTLDKMRGESIPYMLTYCQFEVVIQLLSREFFKRGRIPNSNAKLENLFLSFNVINMFCGIWKYDYDCMRAFNFVHYVKRKLQELKKINLKVLSADKTYEDELMTIIEKTMGTLLKVAHDDIEPTMGIGFRARDISLDEGKKKYYKIVIQQQLLIFLAELLVQMRHFKVMEFLLDETEILIEKYTTAQQYTKYYDLYGTDGLFDILLDKIDELDAKLDELVILPQPPKFTQKDVIAADNNTLNLLDELDKESKVQSEDAKQKMHRKKAAYKKNIAKSTKSKASFFEEKQSNTQVKVLSPEAVLYYEAGRLRHAGVAIEKSIAVYEEAISNYLDPELYKSTSHDYFYIAATLAELADCHIRKALAETPDDFCHLSKDQMNSIIKWYNAALKFAQLADDCFIKHVSILPESALKDFEDLAAHIHTFLTLATNNLLLMTEEYNSLVRNLENAQEIRAAGRAAAIERAGGIENWRRNPTPKNYYREVRKEKELELNQVKAAAKMIDAFIATKIEPIKANFAYLTGNAPLPLLKRVPLEEKPVNDKSEILQGGGFFSERLVFLANTDRLLKSGHSENQVLTLLESGVVSESTSVVQKVEMVNDDQSGSKCNIS